LVLKWHYDLQFAKLALSFAILDMAWMAISIKKAAASNKLFGMEWLQQVKLKYLKPQMLFHLFKVLLWLKIILFVYCNIKQAIPFINPQLYDKQLLDIDKFLTFGFNPNLLIVNSCQSPIITTMIDKLYVLWYFIKPFILIYFVVISSKITHIRFFTCYFSMWIFGGLFALLFPSLGPIYVHPEWFANILKPMADSLQERLGIHYLLAKSNPEHYHYFIYEGIAAFPSLHVGIIAIFAFFVIENNKTFGIIMFIYLMIIQLGSVLLGWHYMVDGLFCTGLAYLLYTRSMPSLPKNIQE
jgi:hypothetical protein